MRDCKFSHVQSSPGSATRRSAHNLSCELLMSSGSNATLLQHCCMRLVALDGLRVSDVPPSPLPPPPPAPGRACRRPPVTGIQTRMIAHSRLQLFIVRHCLMQYVKRSGPTSRSPGTLVRQDVGCPQQTALVRPHHGSINDEAEHLRPHLCLSRSPSDPECALQCHRTGDMAKPGAAAMSVMFRRMCRAHDKEHDRAVQ